MSSYSYYEEDPATSIYKLNTPSYTRHNLSAEYKADKWSVIVGVRNIADKEPPQISQGFTTAWATPRCTAASTMSAARGS